MGDGDKRENFMKESTDEWLGKGVKDFVFFVIILFVIYGIAAIIDSI